MRYTGLRYRLASSDLGSRLRRRRSDHDGRVERVDQFLGDLLAAVRPEVEQLVVAFALGDRTRVVVAFDAVDLLLRLVEQVLLLSAGCAGR